MRKEFNTILAKGKYSNVNILEKRLKEKVKFYSNNHSLNINLNKSNLFYNTSNSSTSPSTKRTTIFTSTKMKKTRPKIDLTIKLNNHEYHIDSNDSSLNFYMTDIPFINSSNNVNRNHSISSNQLNLSFYNKNNKDIKLIKIFEKEKNNSNLFHLKKRPIIEKKLIYINKNRDNRNEYINKTRELLFLNNTIDIKKEKCDTLKGIKTDKIEKINESIKSIDNSINITKNKFFNKFNDYVKFINSKKDIEKAKDGYLIKKMMQLKLEKINLEDKIKKLQQEKNSILKWLYLQIKVYEKIIHVPDYYKEIIELSDENYKNIMGNILKKASHELIPEQPALKKEKKIVKKRTLVNISIKKKIETVNTKKNIDELNIENKDKIRQIYNSFSKTNIKKIRNYKYHLKYNTIDDILEHLKQYENNSINYINIYNDLRYEIEDLKKEKKNVFEETKNKLKYVNDHIYQKEKEFNILKLTNDSLLKEKSNIQNKIKNENRNESQNDLKTTIPLQKGKSKLYIYIFNLYQTCTQLNLKYEDKNIKFIHTKEDEMIDFLQKIEFHINFILNKFKIYNDKTNKFYLQSKEIINKIEKENKILKTKIQKEKDINKHEILKEQMDKRNNKIYFLPRKKQGEKSYTLFNKKEEKIIRENKIKELEMNDFMYE
jgi:hypothetical protein